MKVIATVEYNNGEDYLDIEFEANPSWEDDSFDYEYGGVSSTQYYPPYAILEELPIWDESRYTEEQNNIIREALNNPKEYEKIEEQILREYKEYCDDISPDF